MSISAPSHTAVERLREGILRSCFGPFEGRLASGVEANNILDLQRLNGWPELAALAINQVARRAREFDPKPDAIVPVPNGANWIGRGVSGALGLGDPWILDKDLDSSRISAERLSAAFSAAKRLLIVEDVLTRGTNTRKVLEIPEIGERAIGLVVVWDRGNPEQRPDMGLPVSAVIQECIPPELPPESVYWGYLPDARTL